MVLKFVSKDQIQIPGFDAVKLNRKLSKLMEENHISLTVLHHNTGIPLPTLKRLQTDPQANPTIANLLPIANFFRISINQLLDDQSIKGHSGYITDQKNWIKVPIISWEESIHWPYAMTTEQTNFILTDIDCGEKSFALRVENNDWIGFMQGSLLIINPDLKPEDKDYVIVYKKGQKQPTLRRFLIDEEKKYLKPLNLDFKTLPVDYSYCFLGVLVQIRNDIKV